MLTLATAIGADQTAAFGSDACDPELPRGQAQQAFPDYAVQTVQAERGIVTLLLTQRSGVGTFGVALRAVGGQLYTSQMGVRLSETELAQASARVVRWAGEAALQHALAPCSDAAVEGDPGAALQAAIEAALADQDRGVQLAPRRISDALLVVGTLGLSLAIICLPGLRRLADGFFWARLLSIGLILLTALLAYRAGTAMAGRQDLPEEIHPRSFPFVPGKPRLFFSFFFPSVKSV